MSWLRSKLRLVAARASDALAQAADLITPTLYESRVDEFHQRWTIVARFLESVVARELEPAEQRRLLLESHTRDSLLKLVLLIYEEENNSDRWEMMELARPKTLDAAAVDARSSDSPSALLPPSPLEHASHECLEYLLLKQIIPHLCEAGRRDEPCGIMSLAMQFVAALLSRVSYPVLPTREVHVAVVALIQAAARKEVEDPTVRKYLISLLNIVWKKLQGDPVQTEFFFLHADRLMIRTSDMIHRRNDASTHLWSLSDDPFLHLHNHHTQSEVPELILFTGLLPHMYAVGKIGDQCREALVIAAAMHDNALCRFVLQLTPFCHYAVNGVISAFDALPKTLSLTSKPFASDVGSTDLGADMEVELSFLAVRLRFCCTLAMVARYELEEVDEVTGELQRRSIADELLDQFRTRFLEGPLLEGLLHTSEAAACAATLYARIALEELTACGRDTRANPLLFVYLQFLLQCTSTKFRTVRAVATVEKEEVVALGDPERQVVRLSGAQRLPSELLRHVDSLSSSLCIATIDLFTSVLELQDEYADRILLGAGTRLDQNADNGGTSSPRKRAPTASSLSSPSALNNGAIWFASRFPDSSVASNVHLWKIRAFAGSDDLAAEFPAADDQEDQVLSLLSYIADAEYAACQRGPEKVDDDDDDDVFLYDNGTIATTTVFASEKAETVVSSADVAMSIDDLSTTIVAESNGAGRSPASATSAANTTTTTPRGFSTQTVSSRSRVKPLRDVYLSISLPSFSPAEPAGLRERTPLPPSLGGDGVEGDLTPFLHVVLSRVERLLENSFQENLALSGLLYALAQKTRCSAVVFDLEEALPAGESLRSIFEEVYADAVRRLSRLPDGVTQMQELRRKLVGEDNDAELNAHEADTRLLCGYVMLDEILKEFCSILFARERIKTFPLKPEGHFMEPKRGESLSPFSMMPRERTLSSETFYSDDSSHVDETSPRNQENISEEFEALLAEAQSSMDELLVGSSESSTMPALGAEVEAHTD
ncbi:unnamed protein product [Hyaloperonospora brassicae]|uniref:Retinoic acid induced 16-like protein n=1 Tax=Hyaloperonospora brassicae TaxID=162125 RepID=A0AAV0TTY0_HYABA|nr:unnamed protein product [Hyaloperonospora brassicae]